MGAVAEFTIRHRVQGQRVTVKVLLYRTRWQMLRAARRATGQRFDAAEGLCTEGRPDGNPASTIRLHLETLHAPLMVHECVHAAMNVYRRHYLTDPTPPLWPRAALDHFTPDNEEFAHLVSDLYSGLEHGMMEAGYRIAYTESDTE